MPQLLNVWFDSPSKLQNLSGDLSALGSLQNLTFLQASGNSLNGPVPGALCEIDCDAARQRGPGLECPLPTPGCCRVAHCGPLPTPSPTPPPSTMGECYPQWLVPLIRMHIGTVFVLLHDTVRVDYYSTVFCIMCLNTIGYRWYRLMRISFTQTDAVLLFNMLSVDQIDLSLVIVCNL